jgi:hypothetical protein
MNTSELNFDMENGFVLTTQWHFITRTAKCSLRENNSNHWLPACTSIHSLTEFDFNTELTESSFLKRRKKLGAFQIFWLYFYFPAHHPNLWRTTIVVHQPILYVFGIRSLTWTICWYTPLRGSWGMSWHCFIFNSHALIALIYI